jgi:hypothetical protein
MAIDVLEFATEFGSSFQRFYFAFSRNYWFCREAVPDVPMLRRRVLKNTRKCQPPKRGLAGDKGCLALPSGRGSELYTPARASPRHRREGIYGVAGKELAPAPDLSDKAEVMSHSTKPGLVTYGRKARYNSLTNVLHFSKQNRYERWFHVAEQ